MTLSDVTVVDAKKPLLLRITKDDVKASIKGDPAHCAAAVACMRITGAEDVRVHKSRAYVKIRNRWTRYNVPQSVYREIVAFDRGASFEPGEYRLTPPTPSELLGKRYGGDGQGKRRTPKSKARPQHVTINVRPDAAKGSLIFESLT